MLCPYHVQVCIPNEGESEATGWCKDLCPGDMMDPTTTNNAMSEADAGDLCRANSILQDNTQFFDACVYDLMVPPTLHHPALVVLDANIFDAKECCGMLLGCLSNAITFHCAGHWGPNVCRQQCQGFSSSDQKRVHHLHIGRSAVFVESVHTHEWAIPLGFLTGTLKPSTQPTSILLQA